ncbi:MAG: hypothetical protein FWF69_09575 [Firmicutes bacterium]|nr:hypothetical protein [Bacillota bacterium]
MRGVAGVARADFQERSRRFSFIAMIAFALFGAFWFVPRNDGSLQVITIQPDRFMQAGNASWIPIASAWGLGFFLPFIGFFYLKNTITYDEKSGVSQLIAASPLGHVRYMLGKFCSGTLLLYCFTAVVILGSFLMMTWRFPGQYLSVYDFLSPFAFLVAALPFCAAMAVLFESFRLLRGAIGSVLYVVAFFSMYVLISEAQSPSLLLRSFDFSGTAVIFHTIARAVLEQSGQPMDILMFLGGMELAVQPTAQLIFHGVRLVAADIQGFAGMACVTLVITLLSAPLYSLSQSLSVIKLPKKRRAGKEPRADDAKGTAVYKPAQPAHGNAGLRGLAAELRLMLAGQPFMWKIVSLGGLICCLCLDLGAVQIYVLPLFMLWFVNVFSTMGSREYQHDMLKCIAVIPNGRLRQIVSSWLSGMTLAAALALPVMLRMLLAGQAAGVLACLAGAVFLPSLAIFSGEFTKTRRAFESLFIVMTYVILNNVPAFMYIGVHPDVVSLLRSGIYAAAGITMGVAAISKRVSGQTV